MPGPQPDAISLLRSIRRGGIHPSRALPAAANGHGGQRAGRPTAPLKNPCVGRGALTSPKLTAISHFPLKSKYKEKSTTSNEVVLLGDPCVHLPRTKKQSAGLFFAACGRPSCSIPRTEAPKKLPSLSWGAFFGDPCGNRTHVNGVRGRCLNRLTNGP